MATLPEPLMATVLPLMESPLLLSADADIARGYVGIRADVAVQFGHKALAEAHDLVIALAFRVEIRAALAAADGEACEAVFEDLLETEEFDDGQVDRRVETQAALVRADGAVELNAVAFVHLHVALIVYPGNAEHDDPFRLDQPLQKPRLFVLRVGVDRGFEAMQYLRYRLMKFRLVRVLLLNAGKNALYIRHMKKLLCFLLSPFIVTLSDKFCNRSARLAVINISYIFYNFS